MIDVVPICEIIFPASMSPRQRRAWMFERFDAIFCEGDKWIGAIYEG
jgi:hypothetical protein